MLAAGRAGGECADAGGALRPQRLRRGRCGWRRPNRKALAAGHDGQALLDRDDEGGAGGTKF